MAETDSVDRVVNYIKVIKNNFEKEEEKTKTVTTFCNKCDSELEVSEEDTYIGCENCSNLDF